MASNDIVRPVGWRGLALLLATCGTVALGLLLAQLVYRGWAHSVDGLIYARSLWGIAHGEPFNPVVGLQSLSVHFNVVLYLLAPFAWFARAIDVLLVAQALAFGATIAIVTAGAAHAVAGTRGAPWSRHAWTAGSVGVLCSSAAVVNPFLFDVRPDLLAVPLLTAGLVRAWQRGSFDGPAVAWMCAALLVREESFLVIVGALAGAPLGWWSQPVAQRRLGLRVVGIVVAVGIWGVYWFGVRRWLDDGSFDKAGEVAMDFLANPDGLSALRIATLKVEILAAVVLAGGGLAALGWRWLPAALPGLAFLLIATRMQELVLQFHYVFFVTPGVLVAGLAGLQRLAAHPRRDRAMVAVGVLAVVLFLWSSALPGGGRFRADHFTPASTARQAQALAALHSMVSLVPPSYSFATMHEVGTTAADRHAVYSVASWMRDPTRPGLHAAGNPRATQVPLPDAVQLPAAAWRTHAPLLLEAGLVPVTWQRGYGALLMRPPPGSTGWPTPARDAVLAPEPCPDAAYAWAGVPVQLCGAWQDHRGQVTVVMRVAEAPPAGQRTPLQAVLRVSTPSGPIGIPLIAADGLVPLPWLPVGVPARLHPSTPLPSPLPQTLEVVLQLGDRVLPAIQTDGTQADAHTVPLPVR